MQGATHVLTVTLNAATGAFNVLQVNPIDHPVVSVTEDNLEFVIGVQVEDADGDPAAAHITINVDDDTPTVSANTAVQLDDDALAGGNPGGTGDVNPDTANTSGTLGHSYGADGAGSVAYLTTGAPAGFSYALQGNGDLWVMQGAVHVITLTVNATTGAYTVTQVAPIDHVAGNNENDQAFTINYRVTDGDGDTVDGSIVVNVDDDTPTVSANAAVQLDDDALANGNPGGTGDVNPDTANTSGTLGHSYGADGAGSTAYLTTGAPVGFSYALQGNGDLWVMQGAVHVITLTVNATTGAYTVTQVAPIDHPAGSNENDQSFTISYRVTDHDGDTADGTIVINVDDDTPTATTANLTGTVDEDGVVENGAVGIQYGDGVPGGTGDVAGEVVSATGNVSGLFNSGADTPLTYQLLGNFAGLTAQGLTSGGTALSYSVGLAAGVYTLTATAGPGGYTVFTLTLNQATGAYNFTLVDQLDHPTLNNVAGDNTENDLPINLSSIIQATDHDGDTVAAGSNGLIITVDDDMPVINSVTNPLQIDNDATPSGTGNFDFDIGADENADHDDIAVSNFAVSVNGVALAPGDFHLVAGSETALTASYTFDFTYDTGTGGEATAQGTLVFDKIAGTYTVELTNGPVEGFSLLATGSADASDFVSYQVPSGGSGAPEVTVAALDTDFFVQFSGVAEPGSGTGANNLTTTQGAGGAFNPTTGTFANLELFTQAMSTVQVSSTAAGVAGNTIQGW
jgi:T1SS-143 domain-containing protein